MNFRSEDTSSFVCWKVQATQIQKSSLSSNGITRLPGKIILLFITAGRPLVVFFGQDVYVGFVEQGKAEKQLELSDGALFSHVTETGSPGSQ